MLSSRPERIPVSSNLEKEASLCRLGGGYSFLAQDKDNFPPVVSTKGLRDFLNFDTIVKTRAREQRLSVKGKMPNLFYHTFNTLNLAMIPIGGKPGKGLWRPYALLDENRQLVGEIGNQNGWLALNYTENNSSRDAIINIRQDWKEYLEAHDKWTGC